MVFKKNVKRAVLSLQHLQKPHITTLILGSGAKQQIASTMKAAVLVYPLASQLNSAQNGSIDKR